MDGNILQGTSASIVQDLAYATISSAQKLDLYHPQGLGPFPLIVYVHGGAFKFGDKRWNEATSACVVPAQQSQVLYDALLPILGPERVEFVSMEGARHAHRMFPHAENMQRVRQFFDEHIRR